MRVLFVAVVLLLAFCTGPALSRSTGAPQEACTTVTPNHPPATPQNTINPYRIGLSAFDDGGGSFTYLPGRTYQLTLSAAGNSPTFRGFFIQGRITADDSPVGAFVDPPSGSGVRLSSCAPPNSAITHNSATNKSSITVTWIAPSAGTGAVRFAYAVVQTYSIYWANDTTPTIQGGTCEVPFYESSGVCVETCPQNEFGNHTSGQCEPYATGVTASLNATIYVANITVDTPFGTPVIYLSVVISNPDHNSVFLSISENNLVERVFKFPNGLNNEEFLNLIPDAGSNTITIATQIQYVDDPQNTPSGSDPVTLPAEFGMNINLIAVVSTSPTLVDRNVRAFVTVDPPPDDCMGVDCGNGTCVDGVKSFECMCLAGFNGTFCEINIDECETTGCVNGECTDLIDAFQCDCYPGWTGGRCEVDINYCEPRPFGPCNTTGSVGCSDRNTTYTCDCLVGFTGYNCSQDIDECESIPTMAGEPACFNDGNCTNLLFGRFECSCPSDYLGDRCEIDITPCDPNPCENGGTCAQSGLDFICDCTLGYTGFNCSIEINECMSDPCDNGGTCIDAVNGFICQCPMGYTGAMCDVDENFCTNETCQNNGTCIDGPGIETMCMCAEGFSGSNCSTDLSFCTPTTCMNGGTCTEGRGTMILCDCPTGFTGMLCETDPPDCEPTTCENGGTCVEEYGPATRCICAEGFNGTSCDIDLPFCEVDMCLNGGTCYEGLGTETTCSCAVGFSGSNCSKDLDFCTPDTCYNNGTCIEGLGNGTNCSCHEGFTGTACETDLSFCEEETCLNSGTCFEGLGIETICECAPGFSGPQCESDLSFCQADTCLNGGTCFEEAGEQTRCKCHPDFTGSDCSVLSEPCGDSLYYYSGECTAECPDGYYGNHTTSLCSLFPDDYRVILNATRYTALVTADTRDGEPVITFTVFINNTYFQLPRAVIFQIETNTNASFTFEDGEESDLLTFDPNFDPARYPVLEISKQIVYVGTQPAQAGEYDGELTVNVVNQEGTEVRLQTAVLQITITTGDNTTDVSLTQEPTVIVWIIVGAVALVVLTAVFATVSLCGFLYSRKRKRTDTFDINTGRSNRSNRFHSHATRGSHATGDRTILLEETDTAIDATAVNDTTAALATTTTSFTVPDFSTVISNPSPQHLSEEEGAQQSTRNRVPTPEDGQPPVPEDEQPPAPEDEQPPVPEDEHPPAPEDEQPPTPDDEQPPSKEPDTA